MKDRPHIALTVDAVIFTAEADPSVLLIRRRNPPFKDRWALPGGFVEPDETLEAACLRELEEETGLKPDRVEQLQAFGDPGRDPRGPTVTIALVGHANPSAPLQAATDASEVGWKKLSDLPALAFDHAEIIAMAVEKVLR